MFLRPCFRRGSAPTLQALSLCSLEAAAFPKSRSRGDHLFVLATVAGVGATVAAHKRGGRSAASSPAKCAGADDHDPASHQGLLACFGVGAVVVAAAYLLRRQSAVGVEQASVRESGGDDEFDAILDQMRSFFAKNAAQPSIFGPKRGDIVNAAQRYEGLVKASGSTIRKGIIIEKLAGNHDDVKSFLERVDRNAIGVISQAEFMALSAMSEVMNPRRPGMPPPRFNDVVFGFFAPVDANSDGELTESEWRALHGIMNLFGLLPSLEKTGLTEGNVDVTSFKVCCKRHLDKRRFSHRYGAPKK